MPMWWIKKKKKIIHTYTHIITVPHRTIFPGKADVGVAYCAVSNKQKSHGASRNGNAQDRKTFILSKQAGKENRHTHTHLLVMAPHIRNKKEQKWKANSNICGNMVYVARVHCSAWQPVFEKKERLAK